MRFASTGSAVALLLNACRRGLGSNGRGRQWRRRTERGFTLIEALAAITILALSLSVLLEVHDGGLRGATALNDRLRARLLAQSLLAEWSHYRVHHGPSHGGSGRFTWAVSVVPFAGGGEAPAQEGARWMLHELTVTVAWPPAREIKLTTLRLLRVP
jgi:prepilin-type N-terminal cleavage/methylation domain-containing protein